MLEHLRAPFKKLIEPIAKALIAIGLTANAVTVIGAVGTIVVAIATGVTGWLFGRFVGWLDRRAYHGWDRIRGFSRLHARSHR